MDSQHVHYQPDMLSCIQAMSCIKAGGNVPKYVVAAVQRVLMSAGDAISDAASASSTASSASLTTMALCPNAFMTCRSFILGSGCGFAAVARQ